MRKLFALAGVICCLSIPLEASANRYTMSQTASGPAASLRSFIAKYAAKGLVDWFEQALTCNKRGTMIYQLPGYTEYGTRCNEDGKIRPVSAGINYGLIDRLKAVGVPVDWLRYELADPAKLKAAYDVVGAATITRVVLFAIRGEDAVDFVYDYVDGNPLEKDYSTLSENAANYLKGFIRRRISEANPRDRAEIGRLWGEIINEQVEYLLVDQSTVPEIKRKK